MRLLGWIAVLAATAVARPPDYCAAQLTALFEARLAEGLCPGGACVENVRNFARRLQDAKIPLAPGQVLYLRRRDGKTFRPNEATNGPDTVWRHHAVLLYDGKIYDFDFGPKPKPVDASEYFARMFKTSLLGDRQLRDRGADRDREIHVVQIPAADAVAKNLPKPMDEYRETALLDFVASLRK